MIFRVILFFRALLDDLFEQLKIKSDSFKYEPTFFIWDIGLAYHCNKFGSHEYPCYYYYPKTNKSDYQYIQEGDLVWVRFDDLHKFVKDHLPKIKVKFFLLTGGADTSTPSGDWHSVNKLLSSGKIIHWFTHNYDQSDIGTASEGKFTGIPIGLDFHTRSRKRYISWTEYKSGYVTVYNQQSPHSQEIEFLHFVKNAPEFEKRVALVYADFQLNNSSFRRKFGETRHDIYESLKDNSAVLFAKKRVKRNLVWQNYTQYQFVISPHGNGLDCVRTWEALALGCIVIVKKSPLDPLYQGLPVIIVESWDEITDVNLTIWRARLKDISISKTLELISFKHWYYDVILKKISSTQITN